MRPATVLFLAANPVRVHELQLGEECRAIENMIRAARFRDRICFRSRWAARPDDLLQALNEDAPAVLHFSGHGTGDQGLCFQSDDGSALTVNAEGLLQVIRAAGASVTVVVLNACFSEVQARALVAHVPCVIGMSDAIGDAAAIDYARAFYRALAFGKSVANAHQQGLAALALRPTGGAPRDIESAEAAPSALIPSLLARPGTDPDRIHIVESPEQRRCEIRIRATLREFDAGAIARMTEELRELTNDLSVEIVDIREGSVRVTLSLSPAAREKLLKLRADGRLNEICGFEISAVLGLPEVEEEPHRASLVSVPDEPAVSDRLSAVPPLASKEPRPTSRGDQRAILDNLARALGTESAERPSVEDKLEAERAKRRSLEDERVLSLVAKGDRRGALEAMIELYNEAVFAYCMRMLRDRELAEDVDQQVFVEAYRDIGRLPGTPSMRTWLFGIAHHQCGDAIKSRKRRYARIELDPEALVDYVDPVSGPADRVDLAQQVAALEDCLGELSHDIREIVLLRFLSDMTYDEMAVLLGREANTLRTRVQRALPVLRRCLERKGWKAE